MSNVFAIPIEDSDENQIRKGMDTFAEAVRRKDIDTMMSLYSPDIVSFDIIPPLKFTGIKDYRKQWEEGFAMMQGPVGFETRDVSVNVGGDVAFCHCLSHMSFTTKEGDMDLWMRWTGGFRKMKGKWLVTHEHISVPVDMQNDKPLMNLKP